MEATLKEKLASNLKKLIAVRDITNLELAKELDVSLTTLHRVINAQTQRPKRQIIKKLADFFEIGEDELIGEKEIEWGNVDGWLNTIVSLNRTIPLYSWTLDNCGKLQVIKNDEKIIITNSVSNCYFALKVKDTSMEPLFPLNSIIICNPEKEASHGSYVIVQLNNNNNLVLRKLLQDIDIRYIKPLNEDLGVECTRKLAEKDRILAVVILVQHNV